MRDDYFDISGFAVGVVEKSAMLGPSSVQEGDVLLGIPSNGLHTNGYSLVRHILNLDGPESSGPLKEFHPELGQTLAEALLAPHRSYYQMVRPVFPLVKCMAHITGGGLPENVPRALPEGLAARLDTNAWHVPPIFALLQQISTERGGSIDQGEMYRVFNMGLGMVMVCDKSRVNEVMSLVPEARVVGGVIRAADERRVVL